MQPIRTALCAMGMSGKVFHAPLIEAHPNFELTSIWKRSSQTTENQYPHVEIAPTYSQILENPDIDLIVVNTPEHTHFDLTWKALEAKKHVVVEKAFTPTVSEAEKLIAFAKEQKRLLSVYQNRRWDSDFLTVKKILEEGILGRLVSYEAHYNRYRTFIQEGSWKENEMSGTGILYNLGSHLIDQALLLFGMPQSVYADLKIQREGGRVFDNFDLLMDYEGFKVFLRASYLVPLPGPKYILHGDKGSFLKPGMDPQEEALKNGVLPHTEDWGKEEPTDWGTLLTNKHGFSLEGKVTSLSGNYLAYYSQLFDAIRNQSPPPVLPEEALNGIRIIEAAYESHSHKRAVFL